MFPCAWNALPSTCTIDSLPNMSMYSLERFPRTLPPVTRMARCLICGITDGTHTSIRSFSLLCGHYLSLDIIHQTVNPLEGQPLVFVCFFVVCLFVCFPWIKYRCYVFPDFFIPLPGQVIDTLLCGSQQLANCRETKRPSTAWEEPAGINYYLSPQQESQ